MELTPKLLNELQRRLKIGNRRGVHLNAIPGNSRYKFDLQRLSYIQKDLPNQFISSLLSDMPLRFRISWKDNVPDMDILFEEDQTQLVKITQSFENLINQTEAIESEKGINTFGFGFPILARRDRSDNKLTVAPILIWSLRIKRSREFNTWVITRNEDDPIYLNEVLINHLRSDAAVEVPPIPEEMLDDGLISKDELVEICANLIKEINTKTPEDSKEIFAKNLAATIPIGDKNHYEKLPIHSTNATIDFGGLFSIFEVQKQNIINDYDKLMALKDLSFNLDDIENHSFQSISSVQTDPSQQSILHSLEATRNILIQGPPGTGKSQTLSAILINALENHKKTIVVCEKRTALEVLHNVLIEKDLNYNCILIRDIVKDRRAVVDSVRDRVDNSSYRKFQYTYSKEGLDNLISKAKSLIESINGKHKKLDEKLLGEKNWTAVVGTLLAELNGNNKKDELQLDAYPFRFDATELNELTAIAQEGQRRYSSYQPHKSKSFLDNKKITGDNPYVIEQNIKTAFKSYEKALQEILALEAQYQQDYFNIRKAELTEQLQEGETIQEAILTLSGRYSSNADFFQEEKTSGFIYMVTSLFSKEKKAILNDQRAIRDLFTRLGQHYAVAPDLKHIEFSSDIKNNLKRIEAYTSWATSFVGSFSEELEQEYSALDIINHSETAYYNTTLEQLREKYSDLKKSLNTDGWIAKELGGQYFRDFVGDITETINVQKAYFADENDIFTTEFKWFTFYNSLPKEQQLVVTALKGQQDWRKVFLIHYLNALLIHTANVDLPTNNSEHISLNDALGGLESEQLKYIREYWYSQQIDKTRDFEQKNENLTVENLYNKRSSKRFKRLSLRQIVQYDIELFTTFFPIILTSPDVASNLFRGMNGYFDIVMFDEASQLRLEDNLPALLKGKQVIIAGDEHQMPPSNYFSKVFDGTIEDEDEMDEEDEIVIDRNNILLSCESLLDFGLELNFEKRHLDFHYRSRHPHLIDFSNYAFYSQRLKPLPNSFEYTPIKYVPVAGTFSDHINDTEAEMVLSILENNIHRLPNGQYPTVGIATFNIAQRNHIKSKLLEKQKFTKFEAFNTKILELEENGLFIKNLENIQGDERDVIILSTTYGPGKDGKFTQRFGPINHSKGYKLLNVIITRAKYKVYVCSSIPEQTFMNYKDFLVTEGSNNRRAVFYAYLAYCKAVSEGNNDLRMSILMALGENSASNTSFDASHLGLLESPFEEEVYQRLTDHVDPSKIAPQVKISEFRIDIVYDPGIEGIPKIAIECDGAKYHSSREAYLHDRHRQKILESHGFVFHRIWSTNWWRNPQKETTRLLAFIASVEARKNLVVNDHSKKAQAFTDDLQLVENYVAQKNTSNTAADEAKIEAITRGEHNQHSQRPSNEVTQGSIVTVRYLNNNTDLIIRLADAVNQTAITNGIKDIALTSVLGTSILGHKVGDIVKVGNLDNFVEIITIK